MITPLFANTLQNTKVSFETFFLQEFANVIFAVDKGFAYSGEAGHDVLVTDGLANRLQDALRR